MSTVDLGNLPTYRCKSLLRVLKSHSAAERLSAATEFVRSFPSATELLIISASRAAVDDFVRELARSVQATFGLHRFSLTQLAARLAVGRLAGAGTVPGTVIGAEAIAVRAAYEARTRHELEYFAPVAKFPGFARATAATIGEPRAAGVATKNLKRLDEPDVKFPFGACHVHSGHFVIRNYAELVVPTLQRQIQTVGVRKEQ